MILTGPEIEQLTEALLSAFQTDALLGNLVLFELGTPLNVHVNVKAGLKQQVIDLIAWAVEQRRIDELVNGAVRQRPDNPLLRAFATRMAQKGGLPLDQIRVPAPSTPEGRYRVIPGQDGYALYCNRTKQWELAEAPAFETSSELVFVPGAFEQGHEYFIKRIKRRLAIDPKSVVEVGWPASYAGPDSRGELLEILATALGQTAPVGSADEVSEQIARTLATRLLQRNVVLVHATLSMDFRAGILAYYTEWLPDILRRTRTFGSSLMCLKCYQAVEWLQLPWFSRLRAAFVRGLSSRDLERGTGESDARKLITAIIARQAADVLHVRCLPDLQDITDQDLVDLCNKWAVTDSHDQQQLVERCAVARTSSGKLRIVDAVLPSLLPHERTATPS